MSLHPPVPDPASGAAPGQDVGARQRRDGERRGPVVSVQLGDGGRQGRLTPAALTAPDAQGRHRMRVFDLSLACCAGEYLAAATEPHPRGDGSRTRFEVLGAEPFPAGPGTADVLVVSGTVTEALVPAVRAAYEALQEPRYVVSFGACSNTGGPYWDSYSVVAGVDQIVPVDVYVPGCPPPPEALVDALASLHERLVGGASG